MQISEREQREIKAEDIFKEMIAENFPKLMADTKSHIQTSQRKPCKILKNSTSKHVIFKLQKMKENEKTLQEAIGEENFACKGTSITITVDFLSWIV